MRIEFNTDYPLKQPVKFIDLDEGESFKCNDCYYIKTDEGSSLRVVDGELNDDCYDWEVKRVDAVFLVRGDK